jgi:hypothetical protein
VNLQQVKLRRQSNLSAEVRRMPWAKRRKSWWRRIKHEVMQVKYWAWAAAALLAITLGVIAVILGNREPPQPGL